MKLYTLIVSAIFTLCGLCMIATGDTKGWFVASLFAVCLWVTIGASRLQGPSKESNEVKVTFTQHEPIQVKMPSSFIWTKTIEMLMAELQAGIRSKISGEEIERAVEYERRILPADLKFPKEGEVYEAITNFDIHYMTSHNAPFTGGGRSILPQGERVRVRSVSHEKPIGVYCDPLRYDDLHHLIVPQEEREYPSYVSYYLSIETVDLNKHFRPVVEASDSTTDLNG